MKFLNFFAYGLPCFLFLALSGCTTERSVIENSLKDTAAPTAVVNSNAASFESRNTPQTVDNYYAEEDAYKTALAKGDTSGQTNALKIMTLDRNDLVYYHLMIIENFYATERRQLISSTDWAKTGGDIVQLGLTSAATLVGGVQTKAILAAIATGINGSTLSIDKNILNNGAVEIVTARMQALIEAKALNLNSKLTDSADKYSLRQAVFDLVDVYNCGSFAYAMQDIRNTATKTEPTTPPPPTDPNADKDKKSTDVKAAPNNAPNTTTLQVAQPSVH